MLTYLTVNQWRKLMVELKPLVGETAALAVFRRCLSLSAISYPWLMCEQPSTNTLTMLTHLQQQLLLRPSTVAVAAQHTLWHNSWCQLAKLFGKKLTHQLLQKSAIFKLVDNETFANPNLVSNTLTTNHEMKCNPDV